MNVEEIMTGKFVSVQMDDSVESIRAILAKAAFHHLVVLEGRKLVGVISDRDLLRALSPFLDTMSEHSRDRTVLDKRCHQIMSRDPVTVRAGCSAADATRLLFDNDFSFLPVLDEDGGVCGVLSWKDILRAQVDAAEAKS